MEEFRPIEPEETYITETHSSPEPMRQPVFECKTEDGEEASRSFLDSMHYRQILPWIAFYLLVSAASFVVSLIFRKRIDLNNMIICILVFAFVAFFFFTRKFRTNKSVEQKKYSNNGTVPPVRVCFFEDEIVDVNNNPDNTFNVSYEDVRSVKESDILYILEVQHKVYVLAPKDNMTSNTDVSFEKFITEKATGMKKKKIASTNKCKIISTVILILSALLAAASVVLYFVIK